jgi:hypothetical protein
VHTVATGLARLGIGRGARVSEIFIVQGYTGIYESRKEWIVAAWSREELARAQVIELTELAASLNRLHAKREWDKLDQAKHMIVSVDPRFSIDTSGTHYRCLSCTLKP